MLKIGQKFKLSELGKERFSSIYWDSVFIITRRFDNGINHVQLEKDVKSGFPTYLCWNTDIQPLGNSVCPVCEQEIEIESNKIKQHNYNNELCYGSYTPCSK